MSTIAEITNALPGLSNEELREVERALHAVYRQRHTVIIYDDAYGVWTEADQTNVAAQTFALLDAEERSPAVPSRRTPTQTSGPELIHARARLHPLRLGTAALRRWLGLQKTI